MVKSKSTKLARELSLLGELQRDHGYMLARMSRERDRYTTQVRKIGGAKITMVPARVIRLIVPDDSALGQAAARYEKVKAIKRSGRNG